MAEELTYIRRYIEPVQHPYPFHPVFYLEQGQGFINRVSRSNVWVSPRLWVTDGFEQDGEYVYFQNRYYQMEGFNEKFWSQDVAIDSERNMVVCKSLYWDINGGHQEYDTEIPAYAFGPFGCEVAEFSNIDPSPSPDTMLTWHDPPYYEAITGWPYGYGPLYCWLRFKRHPAAGAKPPSFFDAFSPLSLGIKSLRAGA